MNKEMVELCQRLVIGDILHIDFQIKVGNLVRHMPEEECRELARTVLLRPHKP